MTRRAPEEALAAIVLAHLSAEGWTCYSEVTVERRVCDIVATRPSGIVLACECKAQLGWAVVKQAAQWRPLANYVVVATPGYQRPQDEQLAREILAGLAMGWTGVWPQTGRLLELVAAPPLSDAPGELGAHCRDEHRWWAPAGNARGARFTIARQAARAIEVYVRAHPRCTLDELVAAGITHYRSVQAARALVRQARRRQLGALRVHYDGVRYRFVVDDDTAEAQSA